MAGRARVEGVKIPARQAALVYFERVTTDDEARHEVDGLEAALAGVEAKASLPVQRALLDRARDVQRPGRLRQGLRHGPARAGTACGSRRRPLKNPSRWPHINRTQ